MDEWIDRHSVNCYFCGEMVDERDCIPADQFNNNDGGDICSECLKEREANIDEPKSCATCDNKWDFNNDKPYPCPYALRCYPNSSVLTYGNKSEIDEYWIKRKEE